MATGVPEAVAGDAVGEFRPHRNKGDLLMTFIHSAPRSSAAIGAAVFTLSLAGMPAFAQVKIGFQAPLTGPAATDGVSAKVAAELAI